MNFDNRYSKHTNQDVYRRERDLPRHGNQDEGFDTVEKAEELREYCFNIPCNCETSVPRRLFQNLVNGMKMSVEFFLFMGYVIGRRKELLQCHYPFEPSQISDGQKQHKYPFIHRSTYTDEMTKLNSVRHQLNKKPSSIKHTTTQTFYDIH